MDRVNRRTFLEGTLAVSAGLGAVNAGQSAIGSELIAKAVADFPKRKLGKYDISRLIIGANQFTGYPHAEPLKYAKELFAATMVEQLDMGLEDHDRLIAYVLGLSHALNIAFFTALAESGEAAPRLAKLSSTTFDSQLLVSAAVARDNPHLYFEIQNLNKFGLGPLDALCDAAQRIRETVAGGDEQAFVELMERGREYLALRG